MVRHVAALALCFAPLVTVLPRSETRVKPVIVTEPVDVDSDDPAVWIDPKDPAKSVLLGTDKGGALFAFDLEGRILKDRTVRGLERPNNVDVEYGLRLGERVVDIAVVTERDADRIRVFEAPMLAPLDDGGIEVFAGEPNRAVMGVGLFRRARDGAIFAILTRKDGPDGGLLFQYRLADRGDGKVGATKVRAFGAFSGKRDPSHPDDSKSGNECESVVVDDALSYVYYSEEKVCIHQYRADPEASDADREVSRFAATGFAHDREGLSIYPMAGKDGYLLASDQGARRFQVFRRAGSDGDEAKHDRLAILDLEVVESDGSEIVPTALGDRFPQGLLIAMSDDRTFQIYDWRDILAKMSY